MNCQRCGSERILTVNAKCSDLCFVTFGEVEHDGYVPKDIGIGGGDYIELEICMECGQVQDEFPKHDEDILYSLGVEE